MNKALLIILDGYGEGEPSKFNAVINAKTPVLDNIKQNSFSLLKTDGESVGLFDGDMGGSEVGHTTIGAGRVVPSTAKKIQDEIKNGKFEKNSIIVEMNRNLKENNADLHLFGLMSDKNIHSNIYHLLKIIDLTKNNAKNIFIHFVTDGRDCGERDSVKYLKILKKHTKNIKNCSILSVSGRFYAMDRENNEANTNAAFNAMFCANNGIDAGEIETYLYNEHKSGRNDQYVMPTRVKNENFSQITKDDYIFIFNFREDRIRQIGKKFESLNCNLITMADVGNVNSQVLYPNENVKNTLSEYLSKKGLKQIKISESTKYAHVTYFLNGGEETPFDGEDRIHLKTIPTKDYALTPKMRAKDITKQTIIAMKKGYDAIIVNFSNADMIGHTGNYEATVRAIEFVDKCLKKIISNLKKYNYLSLITADHGNSEKMRDEKGEVHTAHTLNKVFCAIVGKTCKMKKFGSLQDVAPTFLDLMGLKNSRYFEGESLIVSSVDNT